MRQEVIVKVWILLGLVWVLPLSAQPLDLAPYPDLAHRLELYRLWVEDQRAHLGQPGVAIGIVYDQQLVWARGFGVADVETKAPVTPETVFRLGSVSKTFTATAAMALVEAGKLRLDDPVARYLPTVAPKPGEAGAGSAEITLWHLLTHTSGLPREAAFPYWTDRRFPSEAEMLAGLSRQKNLFPPGSDYQYSNLGLALAGAVVERAAGKPYADVVREHIVRPLGMSHTFVEQPPAPGLATGYLIRRADGSYPKAPDTVSNGLTPAANLSSNVLDLARYLSAHLAAGGTMLEATTLRTMHRVQWVNAAWSGGRAIGFALSRQGSRTLVGHGGWVAGHRSQISLDPKAKVGVVVLTNSDEGGPGLYARQAFEVVAPALEDAFAPQVAEQPLEHAERYVGRYHNPSGETSEVLVVDSQLVIYDHDHPPTDEPMASLTRLMPLGGSRFKVEGSERVLEFELTAEGPDGTGSRVGRIFLDENYLFPEGCGTLGPDLRCTWK